MWHIWISNVLYGKVVFESRCHTDKDISDFQGTWCDGFRALEILNEVAAEHIEDFDYDFIFSDILYIDVKQL